VETPSRRDRIVHLGKYRTNPCTHPGRLSEVQRTGRWRGDLTTGLAPAVLAAAAVGDVDGRRGRIAAVLRLTQRWLGLS
jgi:hypothetical protein